MKDKITSTVIEFPISPVLSMSDARETIAMLQAKLTHANELLLSQTNLIRELKDQIGGHVKTIEGSHKLKQDALFVTGPSCTFIAFNKMRRDQIVEYFCKEYNEDPAHYRSEKVMVHMESSSNANGERTVVRAPT